MKQIEKKYTQKNTTSDSFRVPDNYFEHFQDNMLDKIKLEALDNIHDEKGFRIPENYFEKTHHLILEKTTTKSRIVNLFSGKINYSFIAAASIVLFFILIIPNLTKKEPITQITNSSISVHEEDILTLFIDEDQLDYFLDNSFLDELVLNEF